MTNGEHEAMPWAQNRTPTASLDFAQSNAVLTLRLQIQSQSVSEDKSCSTTCSVASLLADKSCPVAEQLKKEPAPRLTLIKKILSVIDLSRAEDPRDELIKLCNALLANTGLLTEIAELYDFTPYPDIQLLAKELCKTSYNLKIFLQAFDADPYAMRADRGNSDKQTDLSNAKQLLTELRYCIKDKNLSSALCYELGQQLTYINALATEPFLVLANSPLMTLERKKLRDISTQLIAQLAEPDLSSEHRTKAQLNLLAVFREQYFRSNGIYLSARQLLLVLLSLQKADSHVLLELSCDDKKNITPILAAMQWALNTGESVDVCVADREALNQTAQYQAFFNAIKAPFVQIRADSATGSYKEDGINYSTLPDLALYYTQQKPGKHRRHLILDDAYQGRTNFKALYELSGPADKVDDNFSWVYPLINEFISQPQHANIQDDASQAAELKSYLSRKCSLSQQSMLDDIADSQLSIWYQSACKAVRLVEGQDYSLIIDEAPACVKAVPTPTNNGLTGAGDFIFGQGVQQLLHARLQPLYPQLAFEIMPESESQSWVASISQLLNNYRFDGRVLGLSLHIDEAAIRACHERLFTLDNAYRTSPYVLQQDRKYSALNAQIMQKITHMLTNIEDGQPIIVLAKDRHHADWLQQQLEQHQMKQGLTPSCALLASDEQDDTGTQQLKAYEGTPGSITVITSSALNHRAIFTNHQKGFKVIQPFFDSKRTLKKALNVTSNNHGQYALIYEQEGLCVSHSWQYQKPQDKRHILNEFAELSHKRNQQHAASLSCINAIAPINHAVLEQFQVWQEFYTLLCSAAEYRQKVGELNLKNEQLIQGIETSWQQQLNEDRDNDYPLISINKPLDLVAYKTKIQQLWLEQKEYFNDLIAEKIDAGSVNQHRFNYLNGRSFQEQVHAKQIAAVAEAVCARKARKKHVDHTEQGFDVNGAMLRYSDAEASLFALGYTCEQLKKLRSRLINCITQSALSKNTRANLINKVSVVSSLLAFEQVLIDYGQRLDTLNVLEKYQLQPQVAQLCRIYSNLGLPPSASLNKLKKLYYDNSTRELVYSLECALYWATPKNQGLGFWLERSAVKSAAIELLGAVATIKEAGDAEQRGAAIKRLYQLLAIHQTRLDGLWIFSFGHKNTRELIKQTLAAMDELVVLANGRTQLNQPFINECQENAHKALMQEQFWQHVVTLEKKHGSALYKDQQWLQLKNEFQQIVNNNQSIYSLDELYSLLVEMGGRDAIKYSPLVPHLAHLRGVLRSLWNDFSHEHHELARSSRYFTHQEMNLMGQLNHISNCAVQQVSLNHTANGGNDSLELLIDGRVDINNPLFAQFVGYKTQTIDLQIQKKRLTDGLLQQQQHYQKLCDFSTHELPKLKPGNTVVSTASVPASLVQSVEKIQSLIRIHEDGPSSETEGLELQMSMKLEDRDRLRTLTVNDLNLKSISDVHSESLKHELTELHNKIHGIEQQPQGWFSNLRSYLGLEVSHDDLLKAMVSTCDNELKESLQQQIDTQFMQLETEIVALQCQLQQDMAFSAHQLSVVDGEIADECQKGQLLLRRFADRGAFYQFLKDVSLQQTQPEAKGTDDLNAVAQPVRNEAEDAERTAIRRM